MATMKTLKFPGSSNVYEMVDATARAGVASLQTAVGELTDDTAAANAAASSALTNIGNLNELDTTDKTSVVNAINETYGTFVQSVDDAVSDWLDAHPEATTTVEDHSLSYEKLINGTLGIVKPEMFGAVGDGIEDDTDALQSCLNNNSIVILERTYRITKQLYIYNKHNITILGGKIVRDANQTFNTLRGQNCSNIKIENVTFDGSGNDSNTSYTWIDAVQGCIILASQCKNIFIEKCKIYNHNYGVFILGADAVNQDVTFADTSLNGVIRDCVFYNCTSPVDTYGKSTIIDHNVFYNNTGASVRIEANGEAETSVDNPILAPQYFNSNTGTTVCNNLFIDNVDVDIDCYKNRYGFSVYGNTHIAYQQGIVCQHTDLSSADIHDNCYFYQKPQTLNPNTRPWTYRAAMTLFGNGVMAHNNYFYCPVVGIYCRGGAVISGNLIRKPTVSGIVHYANSNDSSKTIYKDNAIIEHTYDSELVWWGGRAVCIGNIEQSEIYLINTIVESNITPLYVGSGSVFVKGLISNIESSAITKPSGIYEYSN